MYLSFGTFRNYAPCESPRDWLTRQLSATLATQKWPPSEYKLRQAIASRGQSYTALPIEINTYSKHAEVTSDGVDEQ
jgi:hypothetical protein